MRCTLSGFTISEMLQREEKNRKQGRSVEPNLIEQEFLVLIQSQLIYDLFLPHLWGWAEVNPRQRHGRGESSKPDPQCHAHRGTGAGARKLISFITWLLSGLYEALGLALKCTSGSKQLKICKSGLAGISKELDLQVGFRETKFSKYRSYEIVGCPHHLLCLSHPILPAWGSTNGEGYIASENWVKF